MLDILNWIREGNSGFLSIFVAPKNVRFFRLWLLSCIIKVLPNHRFMHCFPPTLNNTCTWQIKVAGFATLTFRGVATIWQNKVKLKCVRISLCIMIFLFSILVTYTATWTYADAGKARFWNARHISNIMYFYLLDRERELPSPFLLRLIGDTNTFAELLRWVSMSIIQCRCRNL